MEEGQRSGAVPTMLLSALRLMVVWVALAMTLLSVCGSVSAAEPEVRMVVPVGQAVGIKLFSEGVLIVGLSEIPVEEGLSNPALDCGLQQGDIITHINSTQVDTIEEVQGLIQDLEGEAMSIRALRGEDQIQLTATAVQCSTDGAYKLGAWMRDSMAGIGTVTFYDPESNSFGALGHGINDIDTAMLMPLESGSIMPASVADVQKGTSGEPGQLVGEFQLDRDLGILQANTGSGIFGTLADSSLVDGLTAIPVATADEISLGTATILSNISGNQVVEYQVEITKRYATDDADTRDFMIQVVDERLLEETGGIVQGMSGSPILQNGKLIGAVTHVLVNDPTKGYGIFIENMLETANSLEQETIA